MKKNTKNVPEEKRRKLADHLKRLIPKEQSIASGIKGVRLFRIDQSAPKLQKAYEPGIIILAQGQKRIFLGDDIYTYNSGNYLVLSVPLPLECETKASPEEPVLGIYITVDASSIGEILLDMDDINLDEDTLPKGIYSSKLTESLADASIRLAEALASPQDKKFLGSMIIREIIYRVLREEEGGALQALAYRNRKFFQIARALRRIHESFSQDLDVKSLAFDAGMSISTFHASFKAVTNTSPIQYIKNVRLHKARMLMTQEGLNAYKAALSVGYESPSQFSREYKRFFGITPGKDMSNPQPGEGNGTSSIKHPVLNI
ncbi:AraC-type transcriptional regulator N-terminal domain protein [Leptospira fainei serovar Hurstbridge str. BUT 6]|uniref:AraC-type transcriptional regulator N-terminal domain protein n=1 Tax=Leptospira fainei serovar Hurstbridge str. BUT 6 TaxID=1193011 RepID=S3V2A9_9LEPT|nr:AraC family transcriptional regulator [Leptospira fainei]EPG75523.1 AraC-type transcriptional regulator N-terminal domain protein [Leptospira fainei serovar Hurstbridge str. BUT 6]